MDRKRKADDPCDVTVRKKGNSGDVTDKMDRKRKANDSSDDTVRKKANSGDVTEECLSSVDDVLPTPQGSSQSTSHDVINYSYTGLSGGTAIESVVAGAINVNVEAVECSLLQHLIAETSLKIRSRDSTKHVPTYTERAAYRHLKACGSVIIRGRSGSGKSHLGYTLLEKIAKSCSRIPVKVSSPDEWNHIPKSSTSDEKFVVLVEDIFGRTNLNQSSLNKWRKKFDVVWPLVESGQIWLVITSRPEIITQGEPEIFGYEVINKSKEIILDEGVYRLQEKEKLQFLDKLCGEYVRKEDMKEIANINTALGFPQCCTFFATNAEARSKGVEFFKKPFEFIKYLIDCVKNDEFWPEVYFVLLLVFMNEGLLSTKELMASEHEDKFERQCKTITPFCRLKKTCPSRADIKCVAKSLCGVYLLESARCFQFSHRSIYDVLFVDLCEDSPDVAIRMSTPVMLLEFVRTSAQKQEKCKKGNVVFLEEQDYPILADKLRKYLSNEQDCYIVLFHPALQDTEFLRVIFQEWKADDIYKLSRHKGEKVVRNIAIPLSEKLRMPKVVNILEYGLFLSHVIMNHRKDFAFMMIQSLCRYESEDIQPIFNEALLCAVFTCQNDLVNTLLSNGAKPNKLCFRALCNSPRIDTNASSTITRQIECNATNLKLLLVLAICCCNKTVIQVLVQRLTAQSEDHKRFYSHCLEMLLKINGNGHMGVTQMMKNAGSDILEVMMLLEEGGGKLDSKQISLASSHKDSFVLGKLLLRSCDDIHVTDEFSRTPLHLACMYGGADGVKLLLKHGAELTVDYKGTTPFHSALKSSIDQKEKLKLLLDKNSTNDDNFINLTDNMKYTALHYAAQLSDSGCVKMLVEAHAHGLKNDKGRTPLHCAARKQCIESVKLLLPVSDVNAQDSYGDTALHCSLYKEHSHEVIQALVEKGADVGIKNKKDQTPLHCAARQQCIEGVKLFLPVSDVNAQDSDGDTALHCSLMSDEDHSHEVIQSLVEKGADVGIKNKKDETPLHCAALQQCLECVKLFLPVSDVNAQDSDGDTALHCSLLSSEPHSDEVIQVLVEKGADVGIKNMMGKTPLHCAALKQCLECVKLFLPVSDVNAQDSDGDTALHWSLLSSELHSDEVIQVLVEKGADVGIKNKKDETPLHCAALKQCLECVKLFLPVSDVNAQDSDGDTALHWSLLSSELHSDEVIQVLVEKGADVGIKNKMGETPLHCAARRLCIECVLLFVQVSDVNAQNSYGNTALHCSLLSCEPHSDEVIQALVEKGADVGIKNKNYQTPLRCAALKQCVECVKLFLPVSDVNAQDSYGNTALYCSLLSSEDHSHEVIQTLVEKGADVGIKNKEGETPLHCAARQQCLECVKLFLPVSDVNAQDRDGDTALHCSLLHYKPHSHEVIQALVEKGADLGIKNMMGTTPLRCAARRQCIECVKLFLPVSDVNAQDSVGDTALHCSLMSDEDHSHEVIQALVEKGADMGIKNKMGKTPLHCAARQQCIECVKLFLPVSDVNAQDSDGNTALYCSLLSSEDHSHEVIQALVEKGADVGIKNKKDQTPLHCAARRLCIERVKLFLPVSDVNAQDSDGNTALHCSLLSCEPHFHELIQALVEKGADVGIKNKKDQTPLRCAAWRQCVECVKLFLPVSDVNAQDSNGDTALHCSLLSYKSHSHEVIQSLVEKGADLGIKNMMGKTPLHCAAWRQCVECVKLFLPVSDVNAQDSVGNTALHCSLLSYKLHSDVVIQALVEKGADVGIKNKNYQTPLHCAALKQCLECVKLFLPVSDVNAQDSDGNTAFYCCLLSSKDLSREVIQTLVEKGADVGIKNKKDQTPLHCAARKQCIERVKLFLPVSDVNAQDSDGNTALHCSLLSDKPHSHKVIQALVEKGADVGIKNKEGETPLHCAARQQCVECNDMILVD